MDPDVKIIAISGGGMWAASKTLKMAEELGVNRILEKPIKIEVLIKTVNEIVDASK